MVDKSAFEATLAIRNGVPHNYPADAKLVDEILGTYFPTLFIALELATHKEAELPLPTWWWQNITSTLQYWDLW